MDAQKRQEEVYSGSHHRSTETQLVLGGFVLILLVGGALTLLLFGSGPATLAVGVILLAGGLLLALYEAFALLDTWLKKR